MAWTNVGNLKGAAGAPGAKGVKGDQGIQGLQGTPGVAGGAWHVGAGVPPAPTGADGDMYLDTVASHVYTKVTGTWNDIGSIKGVAGAGIAVQGSIGGAVIGTGASGGLGAGDAGKAWIISTAGAGGGITWAVGHMAVWDGAAWHDAGLIQGPAGVQGPPGAKGADGAIGPSATFTIAGAALVAGAAPTISGTGTGADPYVIALPQGADGTDGAVGVAGAQGPSATFTVAGAALAAGAVPTISGTGTVGDPYVLGLPKGIRGSLWFTGAGPPVGLAGEAVGDKYLNLTNGDVYDLT